MELPTGKRTINKNKTTQRINLKSLLGRTPTSDEKTLFAEIAIDTIDNRTLNGKDVNGRKFIKYSKDYAAKKGVTRSSVDMFLEGDMLESMDLLSDTRNTVTIGIEGGKNALKSDNHNNGVTLPKREFFGVTKKEATKIAKEIGGAEIKIKLPPKKATSLSTLKAALDVLDIEQVI